MPTVQSSNVVSPEADMMEKGYHVFPNVLSLDEVQQLRAAAREHFKTKGRDVAGGGKKQANAATEVPSIEWLWHHPRVLQAFRAALGTDTIMFTSHADVQKDVLNDWHKDDGTSAVNADEAGYFLRFAYDMPDCRVYKMGVYLEDHDRDGYGLTVREGSHRIKSFQEGAVHYTGAPAGNVVVFDVRLTHSGQFKSRLQRKLFPTGSRPGALGSSLIKARKWYRAAVGRERIAMFFTFGAPNQYTIDFAKSNMRRQLALTPGTDPHLPESLRTAFEKEGVLMAADHFDDL